MGDIYLVADAITDTNGTVFDLRVEVLALNFNAANESAGLFTANGGLFLNTNRFDANADEHVVLNLTTVEQNSVTATNTSGVAVSYTHLTLPTKA